MSFIIEKEEIEMDEPDNNDQATATAGETDTNDETETNEPETTDEPEIIIIWFIHFNFFFFNYK